LLGQLVAALGAVEVVLATVDLGRLGEDLARDLAESRFASLDASAAILVPSIATTPTDASPARAHTPGRRRTPRPTAARAGTGTRRSS
jgi:hypothetical protein